MISHGTRVLILPEGILGGRSRWAPLRSEAVDIHPAPSAGAALAVAAELRPTLVVFENPLPDMDAAEFCVRLREQVGGGPQLLMISREDRPPDDPGLNAEVDAHLMSPVGSDELLDALMLLLEYGEDRSLRVSTDLLVHLRGFFGPEAGGEAMAMAVELTERTMRIEVSDPLAGDGSGTARFFLPGESAPVELRAWVLLRLDQPRLHYLLAIEPEEDARVRLARFLSSRRAAPEALRSEGGA